MRARMVLTLAAFAAIVGGFSAADSARASGGLLLRVLAANTLQRAFAANDAKIDSQPNVVDDEVRPESLDEMAAMPSLPELPELPAQPEAQSSTEVVSEDLMTNMPVEFPLPAEEELTEPEEFADEDGGFEYDAELMLEPELPLDDLRSEPALQEPTPAEEMLPEMLPEIIQEELPAGERSLLSPVADEPIAEEVEPIAPLPRFSLPPDPFFGSVGAMLGAQGPQTVIPLAAVRPPVPARFFNGQWMNLDPWGSPHTSVDELAQIASGEPLDINTSGAGDVEGRAVLLVDGRALKVKILEWTDTRVNIDLPQLNLAKPTIARVYIADANGTVQDYADFMLQ